MFEVANIGALLPLLLAEEKESLTMRRYWLVSRYIFKYAIVCLMQSLRFA